jgi:hypothetical protein
VLAAACMMFPLEIIVASNRADCSPDVERM